MSPQSMTPIPAQPIVFDQSIDECNEALLEQYCAKFNSTDFLYLMFQRSPCNNLNKLKVFEDSELTTNGTFTTNADDWLLEADITEGTTGWFYDAGEGIVRVNNVSKKTTLLQAIPGLAALSLRISFDIKHFENAGLSGKVTVNLFESTKDIDISDGDDTYTFDIESTANDKVISFIADVAAKYAIDNVSVSELADVTWSGTDWNNVSGIMMHTPGTASALSPDISNFEADHHYLVHVELYPRTAGTVGIYNTVGGVLTLVTELDDQVKDYHIVMGAPDFSFVPSTTYNGGIQIANISAVPNPYFPRVNYDVGSIYITDLDGNVVVNDLSPFIHYYNDSVLLSGRVDAMGMTPGCYKICFKDPCYGITYCSNCIDVKASHDCTKLIRAWSTCRAFGFNFIGNGQGTGFFLQQRLPVLRFNPDFPFKDENDVDSNGKHSRQYAEIGDEWVMLFDDIGETEHRCLSRQLLMDTLQIDGKYYFFTDKDYKPDWDKDGRNNLAQSRITIRPLEDLTFNNNCGCT